MSIATIIAITSLLVVLIDFTIVFIASTITRTKTMISLLQLLLPLVSLVFSLFLFLSSSTALYSLNERAQPLEFLGAREFLKPGCCQRT